MQKGKCSPIFLKVVEPNGRKIHFCSFKQVQRLTSGLIVNHTCKVLDAKLSFVVVFGGDVVAVEFVLEVQLVQHCGICPLEDTNTPDVTKVFDPRKACRPRAP